MSFFEDEKHIWNGTPTGLAPSTIPVEGGAAGIQLSGLHGVLLSR